jgi:hypothetical protein
LIPADFVHKGHKIGICTINLDQPWPVIHDDLLALVVATPSQEAGRPAVMPHPARQT